MKQSPRPLFAVLAAIGILFFAFVCRFWGLSRFNSLVFDEVYFATYGYNYLNGIEFFDVHPPLGKYIIAIGLWLFQFFPLQQLGGGTDGVAAVSAFGYRWIGAAFGTLIPLWVGILAYKLGHRVSFGIIATALTALDGLLLVESRYALINIYLLTFGLLGLICFLMAVDRARDQRRGTTFWLILAGINLGACWSVKWNGLGFLLTVYGVYGLSLLLHRVAPQTMGHLRDRAPNATPLPASNSLRGVACISPVRFGLAFAVVPAIVYRLSWVYHLRVAPTYGFWEMQQQILGYHASIGGNLSDTHPYCSPWFSWPWMIRPVGYYFSSWEEGDRTVLLDVHAFGTPILWWLATVAIAGTLAVAVFWLWRIIRSDRLRHLHLGATVHLVSPVNLSVGSVIAIGYSANFFPWMLVSRCTYLYHYMGASLFSFLALAWVLDRAWQRSELYLRAIAPTVLLICFVAFVFWSPIFFGLPLSRAAFDLRMWMPSWY